MRKRRLIIMTKEKMNVHRALAELKIIDARIFKAIADTTFVTANKHSNEKINGVAITDFKNTMKSNHQKINDLIARKNAMKKAVVLSNANTTIEIDGSTYTVAEAIEMKNHGMDNFKVLLSTMTNQYNIAQSEFNRNSGETLEKKAENYILSVIQAQPKDSKMTVDNEEMQALRKKYIENNIFDIVDPLNVANTIQELSDYITKFETEVDAALSCSNALTIIEFEY